MHVIDSLLKSGVKTLSIWVVPVCAMLMVSTLVMFANQVYAQKRELPEIGNFNALAEEDEYILGRHWLYRSRNRIPILIDEPQLQEYIDQLVYELSSYSGISNPSFDTLLVKDQQINAFAVPGGVLGIHLGLLVAVASEDELASVIAHELGHISQRHYAELVSQKKNNSNLTIGSMLAGLGLMIAGLPTYGVVAFAGGVAFDAESTLKLVRLNESEADGVAFDIMLRSGRDTRAIVTMFERLYREETDAAMPLIFRTHPLTPSRMSQARSRMHNIPYTDPSTASRKKSSLDFFIAQSIARIVLSSDHEKLAKILKDELEIIHEQDKQDGLAFGLARLYQSIGKLEDSAVILKDLQKKYPLNVFISSTLADTEFMLGREELAENNLKLLLHIAPGNYSLGTTLANLYIQGQNDLQALDLLEAMTANRPRDLLLWMQLEEVYGKLDFIDRFHYARAEHYFLFGQYDTAMTNLAYADDKTEDKLLRFRVRRRMSEISHIKRRLEELQ